MGTGFITGRACRFAKEMLAYSDGTLVAGAMVMI